MMRAWMNDRFGKWDGLIHQRSESRSTWESSHFRCGLLFSLNYIDGTPWREVTVEMVTCLGCLGGPP